MQSVLVLEGHVVHVLTTCDADADARAFPELNPVKQVICLKYYLEGDGAMLIELARELLSRGSLTQEDLVHSDLLEQVLRRICEEYLDLSTNITKRVGLRQRLQRQRYDTSTRRHKTYPHLVPLEDMGLVVRSKLDNYDIFAPVVCDGRTPLQALTERFPTIRDLESAVDRGEHRAILAEVMSAGYRQFSQQEDLTVLTRTIFENCRRLRDSGAAIYAIDSTADASYAQMLANQNVLVTRQDIDDPVYGASGAAPPRSEVPRRPTGATSLHHRGR